MGGPKNKTYKRSWRNLLLDKQYQLSFTLLMVGVSALLMVVLGWWVNREAQRATEIFLNDVKDCRIPPKQSAAPAPDRDRSDVVITDIGEMTMVEPGQDGDKAAPNGDKAAPNGDKAAPNGDKAAPNGDEAAPNGDEAAPNGDEAAPNGDEAAPDEGAQPAPPADDEPPPAADDSGQATVQPAPEDRSMWPVDAACQKVQAHKRQELIDGQHFILYVLIAVGLILVFGLTLYGIKMTHHVAGPLHKVSLYLNKMKGGKFDTVYNLRKGDQLVDFYEHFKGAHAGVRSMQEEDVTRLKAIIEVAEQHGLGDKSPEVAAALEELRAIVARKEDGLV